MILNDATGFSETAEPEPETTPTDYTPGEASLYFKLEELEDKLSQLFELTEELLEKVNNLNLSPNEGFSIDS